MKPFSISCAFLAAAHSVIANGQIPVVNGVIGGICNSTGSISSRSVTASNVTRKAGSMRVTENSGICETTQGVYSASGYVDLTDTDSIWFWYFDSRHEPDDSPLTLWFNGGPGSSSMLGLFQELGPCRIKNDSSGLDLNPMSWNNNSNLLFIDQPIGVGLSYGSTNVSSSDQAAEDLWKFLQTFLTSDKFKRLASHDLAIWGESYGGHYIPNFASHILDQNEKVDKGSAKGIKLNLKVVSIGDGLTDPLNQYGSYVEYSKNNPYYQLVNDSTLQYGNSSWSSPGGCMDLIQQCYDTKNDTTCLTAQGFCNNNVMTPLLGEWNNYYVLAKRPDPYPANFTDYLNSLKDKIGAESVYHDLDMNVFANFAISGDWMRNDAPTLAKVVNAGLKVHIYSGDADYILNYMGVENYLSLLDSEQKDGFNAKELAPYQMNGTEVGLFKSSGNLSYMRFYGAGHEVPAYTHGNLQPGEAAFQVFNQIMSCKGLSST